MIIRPWQDADARWVDSMLDPEPDPHWLAQRDGVHGITHRPDRFAATWVAEDHGEVVGLATVYENRYHPGRYPAIVEVRPDRRREGIGRVLVAAVLAGRPHELPLQVRLRDRNRSGLGFAHAVGMTEYQHCPVPTVPLNAAAVAHWLDDHRSGSASVLPLGDVPRDAAIHAAVGLYEWQHERWAPMGDRSLITELWSRHVDDADPAASSIALVDGEPGALCLVWPAGDAAEAIGETVRRQQQDGVSLLTDCIVRSLRTLTASGVGDVQFDGHDDDPHLPAVLAALPVRHTDPVTLLELRPR